MLTRDLLKNRRLELGLTMKQVADACEVSEATISRWESGEIANMRRSKIGALANILQISPSLIIDIEPDHEIKKDFSPVSYKIPVLGYVAGGIPIEQITEILDYEELPIDMKSKGDYFGLKIKGNSMAPRISDGDVVIVRKQNNIENGEIAIVTVNGDEATCKKINIIDNGIMLIPLNAAYEPIFYSLDEVNEKPVKILGKVVELRAKF